MDCMWMKSIDDISHQVDDIKDFAVINLRHNTLLDTHHLANLLFVFKEDRLVNSMDVLFIKNSVQCWERDGGTLLLPT